MINKNKTKKKDKLRDKKYSIPQTRITQLW